MRIAIGDAHRVFAEALATLLKKAGHEVIGWAASLDDVLSISEDEQIDACIIDLSLPGSDRVPNPEALVTAMPFIAFVFLAGTAAPERFAAIAAAGARGIAMKSDDSVEILRVLHGAVTGRPGNRGLAGVALSLAAQTTLGSRRNPRPVFEPGQFLTQREREALASLVRGENTVAMAKAMGVQVSTARSHVDAVLTKLGVHTRIEAVVYAVRAGLVDVPQGPRAIQRRTGT